MPEELPWKLLELGRVIDPPKTAAHYAHTPFPLLTPDMPLATALERFMAFQGERLPVIESEAEPTLAGVVYKTSLLDAYRRMTGER